MYVSSPTALIKIKVSDKTTYRSIAQACRDKIRENVQLLFTVVTEESNQELHTAGQVSQGSLMGPGSFCKTKSWVHYSLAELQELASFADIE